MLKTLKRLLLSFVLIAGCGAVLLLSDMDNAEQKSVKVTRIAIFQFANNLTLDLTADGVLKGLADKGYVNGSGAEIRRYNSQSDMSMANAIAQEIVNSKYDIVVTISTVCLQVMANANKEGKILHIFGAVTDPYNSGVGITGTRPEDHPPHLAGCGTFQPVEDAFNLAKEIYPELKSVGTPWNINETNSEACVKKAREMCAKLGIKLHEVQVESSIQVSEAAKALTSKGVDAIWAGGDNIVDVAIDVVIKAVNEAKIPLFSNYPAHSVKGALFGIGANYFELGRIIGDMAGEVLHGKKPSEIGIVNIVPKKLYINTLPLHTFKKQWNISPDVYSRADSVIKK